MPCFVFRFNEERVGELLFFDGQHLDPVRPPDWLPSDGPLPYAWGGRTAACARTALALVQRCGVPEDLQPDVARLLLLEWVSHMPKRAQTVPEWVVQQEVIRLTLRAMAELSASAGKESENV